MHFIVTIVNIHPQYGLVPWLSPQRKVEKTPFLWTACVLIHMRLHPEISLGCRTK